MKSTLKFSFQFLLLSTVCIASKAFDEDLNWYESPSFTNPLRIGDLNGGMIVDLSGKENLAIPLFYPKKISVLDWMDSGIKDFHTLDELVENPRLQIKPHDFGSSEANQNESVPQADGDNLLDLKTKADQVVKKHFLETRNLDEVAQSKVDAFLRQGRQNMNSFDQEAAVEKLLKSGNLNDSITLLEENSRELSNRDPANSKSESGKLVTSLFKTNTDILELKEVNDVNDTETTLKLRASKPTEDGRMLPAQASEFYLFTKDLNELLKDSNLGNALQGEVDSVAELWAQAEKNRHLNPEVAVGVKSILLQAKVSRTRTDPYGQANLGNLLPDEQYFLIGIDKDPETNVVTIWSKKVEVNPGENLVELSPNDVIYQN